MAQAQSNWQPTTGDWSVVSNWSSIGGGNGSFINNGGTATITTNVTDYSGSGYVYVGGNGGGNGYVNMTGGILNPNGSSTPGYEAIGVASGSGIFTQSGGINVPYTAVPSADGNELDTGMYSSLQLGYSKGGYGEYDMSGGSLGVNVIYVGGNTDSQIPYNKALMNAGTGVFTQTGGAVGSLGTLGLSSSANNAIGLMVGGNWNGSNINVWDATTYSSLGTYTLGTAERHRLAALRRRHGVRGR